MLRKCGTLVLPKVMAGNFIFAPVLETASLALQVNFSSSTFDTSDRQLNRTFLTSNSSQHRPVLISQCRCMGKQSKSDKKIKKNLVDALIEDIGDEDEEQGVVDIQNSELNKFLSSKSPGGGGKKGAKGNIQKMKYSEFTEVVKGEKLWTEMSKKIEQLKTFYVQQLKVRSVASLDDLPVELEGDVYPLNELAAISKKDPKRLIIDSSAFPQATKNIMSSIKNSGMNLSPQQDGLTIYVPIPKVTKEHRDNLVDGAKKKMTECKNDIRKVQNQFARILGEDELADKVNKDDAKAALETIRHISDHFMSSADQLFASKSKELLGK